MMLPRILGATSANAAQQPSGARACIGKRYASANSGEPVPDYVFSAYAKLMRRGLSPAKD